MHRIKDFTNEPIKGNFNESEIQKVDKDEDTLWYIEKKIRKRKRNCRQLSMFLLTKVVRLNGCLTCKIYLWKILQRFVTTHSYVNTHGYRLDALGSAI
jgi:hypothetical protein